MSRKIIIIGGGPSGLTAAYLCGKKSVPTICYEADTILGGISRTIEHKGFRFDVGGHRFFTKIDPVQALWDEVLGDEFLTRPRLSRIFYNGKFFHYPLQVTNALSGLGLITSIRIVISYLRAQLLPNSSEDDFASWVSNRFGRHLYTIFFKTYTEKVWGIPCREIQAEWAAQRIKGLSLRTVVINSLRKPGKGKAIKSLIEEFQYPRLGPGQMYETMGEKAMEMGSDIMLDHRVKKIHHQQQRITGVDISSQGKTLTTDGTDFISTMPLPELVQNLSPKPPATVLHAAQSLRFRALLTVNFLIDHPQKLPDTWVYIHDSSVQVGRVQFFANWSPYMVPNPQQSSLGMEYFCWEDDPIWTMDDSQLIAMAKEEVAVLGLAESNRIFDGFVVRMPKSYPVYDDQYARHVKVLREYLAQFNNLQLCGRYGLFKYNNMDHSILTAMQTVENIFGATHDVWEVNADDDYHEESNHSH